MQFAINSFRQLFPDKIFSLIFSKIPDISLTADKFPDISRFSRQVVILLRTWHTATKTTKFTTLSINQIFNPSVDNCRLLVRCGRAKFSCNTANFPQITLSKLLTYCVLRPTQPPIHMGYRWQHGVAGGMSASCTIGPTVQLLLMSICVIVHVAHSNELINQDSKSPLLTSLTHVTSAVYYTCNYWDHWRHCQKTPSTILDLIMLHKSKSITTATTDD